MSEYLLNQLGLSMYRQRGIYAVLIGSGVSRTARVPTGWEITLDLARRLKGDLTGSEDELAAWYLSEFGVALDYSDVVQRIEPTDDGQRGLLEGYFEPTDEEREEGAKLPTSGHHALAGLVAAGYVRVILTTNFDRLMETALREVGVEPAVISHSSQISGMIPLTHQKALVVKLHGDFKDIRIRNSANSLSEYDPQMNDLLDRVLDEFGLVLVGWSARYDHALRAAIERMQARRFSAYWVEPSEMNEVAAELAAFRRASIVTMSADDFFSRLQLAVEANEAAVALPGGDREQIEAQVKQLMSRPERYWIRLEDLVLGEAERLKEAIESADPAAPWLVGETAQAKALVDYLEAHIARLTTIAVTIAHYDHEGRWDELLRSMFSLVAVRPSVPPTVLGEFHAPELLLVGRGVRMYPAALLLFAVLIEIVKDGRSRSIRSILNSNWSRGGGREGEPEPLATLVASLYRNSAHNAFRSLNLGPQGPRSAPVARSLLAGLARLTPQIARDNQELVSRFMEVEFLLSLETISIDAASGRTPTPLYGLYYFASEGRAVITRFLRHPPVELAVVLSRPLDAMGNFDAHPGLQGRFPEGFTEGAVAEFHGE